MKNDRFRQAAILSDFDYSKIRKQIKSRKYKLLLDLAWYTGEQWGRLLKLRISDCFEPNGSPRECINFRSRTRKVSPDGEHKTRQVPVHEVLRESLSNYKPELDSPWLFSDRTGTKPITFRWADMILRSAVERAGLSAKGISTHSTRRSCINKLYRNGTDISTIQKITGHRNVECLKSYFGDSDRVRGAIAAL